MDDETLGEFEADLKNNLFKIWNRMSSGSYFPPPVEFVEAWLHREHQLHSGWLNHRGPVRVVRYK